MSHINTTFDPTTDREYQTDDVCENCGGSGEYCIPAHQYDGRIVDEVCYPCICTKDEEQDTVDER